VTGEVSVIVPTRGEAPYFAAALASLQAQAAPIREVLVVDDGMAESARAVLAAARLCQG
jgi:glycosyltransferase involved in cell wall biosynthesis